MIGPITRNLSALGLSPSNADALRVILVEGWRYALVSAGALALDYATFLAAVNVLHLHYLVANGMSFVIGVVAAYVGSAYWAFAERRFHNVVVEFIMFALTGVAGLAAASMILFVGVDWCGFRPSLVKLASIGVSFMCNFAVRKIFLFTSD